MQSLIIYKIQINMTKNQIFSYNTRINNLFYIKKFIIIKINSIFGIYYQSITNGYYHNNSFN